MDEVAINKFADDLRHRQHRKRRILFHIVQSDRLELRPGEGRVHTTPGEDLHLATLDLRELEKALPSTGLAHVVQRPVAR